MLVFGKARDPQPLGDKELAELPLSKTTSAVLVEIVGGGGSVATKTKFGSGTLFGQAAPFAGFAADVPNALSPTAIEYPMGLATVNVRLSLFVTSNNFVATTTRFEIYRDGAATGSFIDVLASVFGATVIAVFATAFGVGERFDLRVSNPGGVAEVGKIIDFGYSADFF